MMYRNLMIGAFFVALAVAAAGVWHFALRQVPYSAITSYEQCAAAGYPILESYPEQCKVPDGRTFVRDVSAPPGPGETDSTGVAFGTAVTLRVGEKAVFADGLSLLLKEINDSRCKPDVQCIWAGELSALFSVTSGGSSKELRLGTMTAKSANAAGYTFTLKSATTESVTLMVAPSSAATTSGVTGNIHLGPTCPVERVPEDPACADRPYANAKVSIRNAAGTVVRETASDAAGNFRAALPPGTYRVSVAPSSSRFPVCSEQEVNVASGAFTKMDISCDSGIR